MAGFDLAQRRRGLSVKTIETRRSVVRSLSRWLNEHNDSLLTCKTDDIERWLDSCALSSARSRSTYLTSLRAFYDWCVEAAHIEKSPAHRIRRPNVGRLVPRPMNRDDLSTALNGADGRMRLWLCLGAYQGLRTAEMAGIVLSDFLVASDPPALLVRKGKGGHERLVPLNPATATALRLFNPPVRGPIFLLEDDTPIKPSTISAYIGRYLHGLGIQASAHQLRHWFATAVYAASGQDLLLTQSMLGHSSPDTTSIYAAYSHPNAVNVITSLNAQRPAPGERPQSAGAGERATPPKSAPAPADSPPRSLREHLDAGGSLADFDPQLLQWIAEVVVYDRRLSGIDKLATDFDERGSVDEQLAGVDLGLPQGMAMPEDLAEHFDKERRFRIWEGELVHDEALCERLEAMLPEALVVSRMADFEAEWRPYRLVVRSLESYQCQLTGEACSGMALVVEGTADYVTAALGEAPDLVFSPGAIEEALRRARPGSGPLR